MLFVLAFDHRNSFRKDFFGIEGEPTADQQARCREAKLVILDGLLSAVRAGLPAGGRAGVLVDDEYGAAAAMRARSAGVTVAIPVERSGQRELQFEHEPFYSSIRELSPEYVKVLVRYNPDGDAAMNARQRTKLSMVQEWTVREGVGFMLELLVPAESSHLARLGGDVSRYDTEERPRLTVAAVKQLASAGLRPELWKLEGMNSRDGYAAIADAVLSARSDSSCLVLGRGADEAAVDRWLRLAAPVRGFSGFAVGRTIWWKPLRALYDGGGTREDTVEAISANYLRLVRIYTESVPLP
jgi:myo-inositol catabolism protein IolC